MKLVVETCPMFNEKCRFCSIEYTTRSFTRVEKDPRTGLFKPIGQGTKRVEIGDYCNNHPIGHTGWIADMHVCPRRYALAAPGTRYLNLGVVLSG